MPYFDFHVHPTLKSMFSKDEDKTNPWIDINIRKNRTWITEWCTEFKYILPSQCGLHQMCATEMNLACIPLIAPERGMTTAPILSRQSKINLLNRERLAEINNPQTSPFALVLDDIEEVLLNEARFNVADKKVQPLGKGVIYNALSKDTIFVAFTIEGAHSLSDTFDKTKINADTIIRNLDILREKYPVISLNLTHLEQFPFCNHAYGMQFLNNNDFYPNGNRISNEGITIIQKCYERNVVIDVKHMSVAARKQFTDEIRQSAPFKNFNLPIACTHAGFAGLTYADIPDYIERKAKVRNVNARNIAFYKPRMYKYGDSFVSFNPTSINLYDDDIIAILKSGGIIGLSLDKRILGYTDYDTASPASDLLFEDEFISLSEEDMFFSKGDDYGSKVTDEFCISVEESKKGGIVNPKVSNYHLAHFMAHILHLIVVCRKYNYYVEKGLKQVCIGSDMDGIINPVWCCLSIAKFPELRTRFINEFEDFVEENNIGLPVNFDVKKFSDDLFYNNGKNFLFQRLAIINS